MEQAVEKPTPQTHPDMEGFEDPGYLLAVSPTITTTAKNPHNNDKVGSSDPRGLNSNTFASAIRKTYNKSIQPKLPIALKYKCPARTNLVLSLALMIITGFWLVTKAPAISAAVFSFVVFGVFGPLVG